LNLTRLIGVVTALACPICRLTGRHSKLHLPKRSLDPQFVT